jgi:hypothetical protein
MPVAPVSLPQLIGTIARAVEAPGGGTQDAADDIQTAKNSER